MQPSSLTNSRLSRCGSPVTDSRWIHDLLIPSRGSMVAAFPKVMEAAKQGGCDSRRFFKVVLSEIVGAIAPLLAHACRRET
jgi:hypothetical protein